MQIENIIDSLSYTIKSCKDLLNKEDLIKENMEQLKNDKKEKEEYLKFIQNSRIKYQVAVNELYEESIVALQNTLNTSLQYVFFDKNYKVKLSLKDTRGNKSLELFLIDNDEELEVDLRDVGQGVRAVISFVLKSYYLLCNGSRILLLDEKYSNISNAYVPRFFDFVESFCRENDFIIVMISHIDNQIEHADKVYYLNDGVITEEKEVE